MIFFTGYEPPPKLLKRKCNVIKHHEISSHDKLLDCFLSSSATNSCDGELLCTDVLSNENNQNNCNVVAMSEIPVIASTSTYIPVFETESKCFISYICACVCICILLYVCMYIFRTTSS